jgi:uncharacterized membrane protein YphA (DoxX/SURF4 family)
MIGRDLGIARLSVGDDVAATQQHNMRNIEPALRELDRTTIALANQAYPLVTRVALFIVYFWFGFIKLIGLSEATGLAKALTAKTVGLPHFQVLFTTLAVFECVIGVLCLIPRATRLVVALLVMHLAVVCAPLVLVPDMTWQAALVPTMDGQYILKNVLIIAAAIGLVAHAAPSAVTTNSLPRRHVQILAGHQAVAHDDRGRDRDLRPLSEAEHLLNV